jgi:hypothetical protein
MGNALTSKAFESHKSVFSLSTAMHYPNALNPVGAEGINPLDLALALS